LVAERGSASNNPNNPNYLSSWNSGIHEMDLARIFELSSDMVFLCEGDRVVFMNSFGRRVLLGNEGNPISGRSFSDFLAPDYAPIFENLSGLASGLGDAESIPLKLQTSEGVLISADVSFFEAEDFGPGMLVITAHDITDRVRLTEGIQRSEARYRMLIEQSQNMFCICDDGVLNYVNSAGIKLMRGENEKQFIGTSFFKIIHDDFVEIIKENLGDILADQEPLLVKLVCLDGSIRDVRMNFNKLDESDGRKFMIEAQDVTLQNQAAVDLYRSNLILKTRVEELFKAKERAESSDRVKSHFLANMSHELRTPLNAIVGFSDLMRSQTFGDLGSEKYVEYAKHIHQSGAHLLRIISNILEISNSETGDQIVDETSVNLNNAVESCLEITRDRAKQKNVQMIYSPTSKNTAIRADSAKLRQILLNLLSNAIKFTEPKGTVTIEYDTNEDNQILVRVTDTGIGIEQENISQILSPFAQVEYDSLTRSYEGAGLGLSIVKSFVELHGGQLKIESESGKGTQVTVFFPAERTIGNGGGKNPPA